VLHRPTRHRLAILRAMHTIEGLYDNLRHNPHDLLRFWAMDTEAISFGTWSTQSIYVHDMHCANGTPPQGSDNAFERVNRALPQLVSNAQNIAPLLIKWPEGREGNGHCVGGGWTTHNVTFYVARGLHLGRWCKFLCANVY